MTSTYSRLPTADGILKSMYHKVSKRRKRAQLAFVYFVMVMAVLSGLAVLLMVVQGYRFNRFDGKVEQGGLVQFDSQPAGADVTLDTMRLGARTASKITASAGEHTVVMSKPGYTSWQKTVTVKPGAVLWLNYARMLPVTPRTDTVHSQAVISDSLASPDKKKLAVLGAANDPTITLLSIDSDTATPTKLVLPATAYTAAPDPASQRFDLLAWDKDNRTMLMQHSYGETTEFIQVDTRDIAQSHNISAALGLVVRKVVYSYADSNLVYLLTATNELRQANLSERTVTGPLLTNVADMAQFDKATITFTTLPDSNQVRQAGYLTIGTNKPKIVRSQAEDDATTLGLRIGRYYNTTYVVISHGDQLEILTGGLPSSDSTNVLSLKRIALLKDTPADSIGFSPGDNRFVYAQKGTSVVTYDLELLQRAAISLPAAVERDIDWLDGYHIATSLGGAATFMDFDGTNHQTIATKDVATQPIVLANGNKYLYHVSQSESGGAIVRTKLSLD